MTKHDVTHTASPEALAALDSRINISATEISVEAKLAENKRRATTNLEAMKKELPEQIRAGEERLAELEAKFDVLAEQVDSRFQRELEDLESSIQELQNSLSLRIKQKDEKQAEKISRLSEIQEHCQKELDAQKRIIESRKLMLKAITD